MLNWYERGMWRTPFQFFIEPLHSEPLYKIDLLFTLCLFYTMDVPKPFLKWVGGKTQILPEVMKRFPPTMNHYHEPFVGGGSVLLALLAHRANGRIHVSGRIYASDINANLIGLYKNVQSDPDALLIEVKKITDEFTTCKGTVVNRTANTLEEARTSPESYYFWIRQQFNSLSKEERVSMRGSAMVLFMNKTCFRGMYREGPHGFNVPFGNYKNPSIVDGEHIKQVSALLREVEFSHASFTEALNTPTAQDFVYLDPPYAPEQDTSFVAYTTDGFTLDHHKELFRRCHEMTSKKVRLLLSNAHVPLVTQAFPVPYTTHILSCRRSIHSKKPETRTNEVLITNEEERTVS